MENNKLLYEEKRLLALYRQMMLKEYDIDNREIYENNIELKNHVEMQKAIYLAYNLLWINTYGFFWDTYGPKSVDLENNLFIIDNKRDLVEKYYADFDDNIYSQNTKKKIIIYQERPYDIDKLINFNKHIEEILKEEKGIELLADLCFITKSILPNANFEIVNKELQTRRQCFNNKELNKFAFNCLEYFDLIDPIYNARGKVKRINRNWIRKTPIY